MHAIFPAHLIVYYAFILIMECVSLLSCSWAEKACHIERLHPPARPMTGAVMTDTIKGTPCACEELKVKNFIIEQFSPDLCQHILVGSILFKTVPVPKS